MVAAFVVCATFAATGWIWAVPPPWESVSDGVPPGILWETPTVPVSASAVIDAAGDKRSVFRAQVADSAAGRVIDIVEAAEYEAFSELLA